MKFTKAPAELVETFAAVVPGPPVVQRPMFGYPSATLNGNMFAGLFGDSMILRLPEELRAELIAAGAQPFAPMPGRVMREYVTVPGPIVKNRAKLAEWVAKSLKYAETLPPKAKRKPATKASASHGKQQRPKEKCVAQRFVCFWFPFPRGCLCWGHG
jgi:TfoX/Sxy family transcriptional regulator of competence genes